MTSFPRDSPGAVWRPAHGEVHSARDAGGLQGQLGPTPRLGAGGGTAGLRYTRTSGHRPTAVGYSGHTGPPHGPARLSRCVGPQGAWQCSGMSRVGDDRTNINDGPPLPHRRPRGILSNPNRSPSHAGCVEYMGGLKWASKGQVRARHSAPAAPAFPRPSSPSQCFACSTLPLSAGPVCISRPSLAGARDVGLLVLGIIAGHYRTLPPPPTRTPPSSSCHPHPTPSPYACTLWLRLRGTPHRSFNCKPSHPLFALRPAWDGHPPHDRPSPPKGWWWWVCRARTCTAMGWCLARAHPPPLWTTVPLGGGGRG